LILWRLILILMSRNSGLRQRKGVKWSCTTETSGLLETTTSFRQSVSVYEWQWLWSGKSGYVGPILPLANTITVNLL
jgi:hypothetical protein